MTGTLADTRTLDSGWILCPGCRGLVYGKRFTRNLKVCPECGHHHQLSAWERAGQLLDPGTAEVLDLPAVSQDVLAFVDVKPYPERLEQARRRTGLDEGVLVLSGKIEGRPLIAAVMDFGFLGGSLGAAAGELIAGAAETALQRCQPLLIVAASGEIGRAHV